MAPGAHQRSCAAPAGLAAVIRRRPWRCGGAARVGGPRGGRAGRRAAAGRSWAGAWCLSAPSPACAAHPSLRCWYCSLRHASQVCSAPAEDSGLRLLGSCLVRALQRLLDAACPCRCVARERRTGGTRPFSDCSPSSAGSFLTAFARAARGISRQAMAPSCPAPSKYPGCVVGAQVDGRGSPGVSRRLPLDRDDVEVLLLLSVAAHGLEHTEQALSSKS